jgi:hypothetical protein
MNSWQETTNEINGVCKIWRFQVERLTKPWMKTSMTCERLLNCGTSTDQLNKCRLRVEC